LGLVVAALLAIPNAKQFVLSFIFFRVNILTLDALSQFSPYWLWALYVIAWAVMLLIFWPMLALVIAASIRAWRWIFG